jgi:hypothetical protein
LSVDGPSTVVAGYDDWALGQGYMTVDQWKERVAARGAGAAIGTTAVAAGAGFVGELTAAEARGMFGGCR